MTKEFLTKLGVSEENAAQILAETRRTATEFPQSSGTTRT